MKLKEWWRSLDSTEIKLLIFIIIALLVYGGFWVAYSLGLLRYLDQPGTMNPVREIGATALQLPTVKGMGEFS